MANPILNESKFTKNSFIDISSSERMTVQGAVNKSFLLFALMLFTSAFSFLNPNPIFMMGGAIVGLITVIFSSFKPQYSNITAPIYALAEGFFIGAITYMYAVRGGNGLILQAVSLTIGVLFLMLFFYKSGLIKVTPNLRAGIFLATGAIALTYLVSIVLSFFGMSIPFIHEGGTVGIIFSLVVVGIAAFNLLLDFDMIEKGAASGAPKYMEWFAAMGLLVTIVWLYVEILRLLSKVNRN